MARVRDLILQTMLFAGLVIASANVAWGEDLDLDFDAVVIDEKVWQAEEDIFSLEEERVESEALDEEDSKFKGLFVFYCSSGPAGYY